MRVRPLVSLIALSLALALPPLGPYSIALPLPFLQLTAHVRAQGPLHPRI